MAGRSPGRKPKPTNLKILHGESRPSHLNPAEPAPRDALPVCPDDVTDEVREIWNYTVRELDAMNLAHAADRDALHSYCEAVVRHRRLCRLASRSQPLITGQKGNWVTNPIWRQVRDAAAEVRAGAAEFGLTPSSRSRIEVKGSDDGAQDNPFAGAG